MKILITNHHLRDRGGSEKYTLELAKALRDKNVEVTVYSPNLAEFSKEFKKAKIEILDDISKLASQSFDVIHAHHNITAIITRSVFPTTPMIFVSHGIKPELEQAPSLNIGISKFIAVSEEVRDNLVNKHKVPLKDIEIIRNFVDLNRFKSIQPVNEKLRKLLVISNHFPKESQAMVKDICNGLNIEYTQIGLPNNPVKNVSKYINESDLVISLGKGVLEAMASERNVIVYDHYGGDGFIDPSSYEEIRQNNFSGRRFSKKYSKEEFIKELNKYNPKNGKTLRKIIKKNHNIDSATDKYLSLYHAVKNDKVNSSLKKESLLNELLFLEYFFSRSEDLSILNKSYKKRTLLYKEELRATFKVLKKRDDYILDLEKQNKLANNNLRDVKKQYNYYRNKLINTDKIKDILKL